MFQLEFQAGTSSQPAWRRQRWAGLKQALNHEEQEMRKRGKMAQWVLVTAGLIVLVTSAWAEEKYTVSGAVTFPEGEVVFVSLYTPERFKDFGNKPLPPEPYTQVIELTPEQKRAGRAEFLFKDIPQGTYGVIAFREIKKSLKRDRSRYFKDPVSAYKMLSFSGKWSDIRLEVNKDIRGIEIRF
jgi:hypothetical protein